MVNISDLEGPTVQVIDLPSVRPLLQHGDTDEESCKWRYIRYITASDHWPTQLREVNNVERSNPIRCRRGDLVCNFGL